MPWQKGKSGNPKGFQSYQRALYKRFYKDAKTAWDEKGIEALYAMAEKSPASFCQMMASMMPKSFDIDVEQNTNVTLSIDSVLSELGQIAHRLGNDFNALPHQQRVIEHDETKRGNGKAENEQENVS
jgi:hypothetical protein